MYKLVYTPNNNQDLTTINLPSSKSISNRLLLIQALSQQKFNIQNLAQCDDTTAMLEGLSSTNQTIDIGAAGTAMRFLTAYYAITGQQKILTGSERMKNRPILPLVTALNDLGANITYLEKEGYPPLQFNGKIPKKGHVTIDANISSQYISALIMIAPLLPKGLQIKLQGNIVSKSYINLTLGILKEFAIDYSFENNIISIQPKPYFPHSYLVESDWSAASYFYAFNSLFGGSYKLNGLSSNSIQPDSICMDLFSKVGVLTSQDTNGLNIQSHYENIQQLNYNFKNCPDIAQTLVVFCLMANIPFKFTGLQTLRIKETDRLTALQTEVRKLGYIIHIYDKQELHYNLETIQEEENPILDTYNDHRMAMALSMACKKHKNVSMRDVEVVSKSFPTFWIEAQKVGINLQKI